MSFKSDNALAKNVDELDRAVQQSIKRRRNRAYSLKEVCTVVDPSEVLSNDEASNDAVPSSQTVIIKTLSEGHSALQANLEQASTELLEKEAYQRDLEDEESRQREKNWLMEERIRSMTEKLCCMSRALERREKKQESLFTDVAEAKWKLQEAKQLVEKLKLAKENFESKTSMHKQGLEKLDGWQSNITSHRQQIREEIKLLQSYKFGLDNGDTQLCAIRNGSKLKELEQIKQALRDGLNERGVKCEAMLFEIDEKTEKTEQLKLSLQAAEKQYALTIKQLKNRIQCQLETDRRMRISNEYLRSKVDYSTNGSTPRSHVPPVVTRQVVLPLQRRF
ncbi:hypothetical protein Ocin01_03389 [Orchesella cincta]|uniref:Uncharacterized protein n=1 Tax=Orchesella cincta TaxID=48709 RepID=A0A1D2NDD5_ORCCI|nr:hypothetical protein Ocin01_03389 [Orchesella cincta]